jgi:hypothetical protein
MTAQSRFGEDPAPDTRSTSRPTGDTGRIRQAGPAGHLHRSGHHCRRAAAGIPRWVLWEGIATVAFLVIGGLAFVIDATVLTLFLDVSLLLLLLWAAAASITILRRVGDHRISDP